MSRVADLISYEKRMIMAEVLVCHNQRFGKGVRQVRVFRHICAMRAAKPRFGKMSRANPFLSYPFPTKEVAHEREGPLAARLCPHPDAHYYSGGFPQLFCFRASGKGDRALEAAGRKRHNHS